MKSPDDNARSAPYDGNNRGEEPLAGSDDDSDGQAGVPSEIALRLQVLGKLIVPRSPRGP